MTKTRDNYQITGATVEDLKRSLNFMLQRMADRMDKIEGIRGTASIESDLDMNLNRVTEVASAIEDADALNKQQADLTGNTPTFANMTITNLLTVDELDVETVSVSDTLDVHGNVYVYDADNHLIHSLE